MQEPNSSNNFIILMDKSGQAVSSVAKILLVSTIIILVLKKNNSFIILMGNSNLRSKNLKKDSHIPFYQKLSHLKKYEDLFADGLMLSESRLQLLYEIFVEIGFTGNGFRSFHGSSLSLDSIYLFIDEENNKFISKLFSLFDRQLNFRSFVLSIWDFCSVPSTNIPYYFFDLYDENNNGILDVNEVKNMFADLFGDQCKKDKNALHVLHDLNAIGLSPKMRLNKKDFFEFTKKHSFLLQHGRMIHQKLRSKIIGDSFWDQICTERFKAGGNFNPESPHHSTRILIDLYVEKDDSHTVSHITPFGGTRGARIFPGVSGLFTDLSTTSLRPQSSGSDFQRSSGSSLGFERDDDVSGPSDRQLSIHSNASSGRGPLKGILKKPSKKFKLSGSIRVIPFRLETQIRKVHDSNTQVKNVNSNLRTLLSKRAQSSHQYKKRVMFDDHHIHDDE